MWRRCVALFTTMSTMTLVACHTAAPPDEQSPPQPVEVHLPDHDVTVLDSDDPAVLALHVSQLLFDRAPVVVLGSADDPLSHDQAAATAEELGAPVLLVGGLAGGAGQVEAADDQVTAELGRLGAETVLPFGATAQRWAEDSSGVVTAVGVQAQQASPAPLPPLERPEPLPGLAVLAFDEAASVAATATARAAGATVHLTDVADPRADPALIDALAASPPTHTIALGADFGPADRLRTRVAVATTGVHLPGGGQVMFPGRRLIALYGHPNNTILGVLGEQPLDDTVARARQVAAEYESLVDEPVVPTFEIITTIASSAPGPEGDYSSRTPVETLRPWVDAAAEAGIYVVLDLQPGHTDFLTQAKLYEQLLLEPHVGLALDPEWRLAPGQQHMVNIGSVTAAEVNEVVDWLAELTAQHRLPQKLLVVHQFTLAMIQDRSDLDVSRDEVAVLIHADGFGTPGQKMHTWEALLRNAPDVWWGWKNFYDEDDPTFTPAETIDIDPSPWFVSYQ